MQQHFHMQSKLGNLNWLGETAFSFVLFSVNSIIVFLKPRNYNEQDNVWGSILICWMRIFFNGRDPIITDKKSADKPLLIGDYPAVSGFQVYHTVMNEVSIIS